MLANFCLKIPLPSYSPPSYTSASVLAKPPWADSESEFNNLPYNEFDDDLHVIAAATWANMTSSMDCHGNFLRFLNFLTHRLTDFDKTRSAR